MPEGKPSGLPATGGFNKVGLHQMYGLSPVLLFIYKQLDTCKHNGIQTNR